MRLHVGPCRLGCFHISVDAESAAEHIRLDLALDEAVDLKRSAANLCYNQQFVRVQLFCFYAFTTE